MYIFVNWRYKDAQMGQRRIVVTTSKYLNEVKFDE